MEKKRKYKEKYDLMKIEIEKYHELIKSTEYEINSDNNIKSV